ncbi:hypothetical protein [uncultured Bacteroides sp.]|uniref:gp53-like domain-containing protein n=1 Tax=uncultured Bacteroides sp. TaxID=162156 RepID=UPI0026177F36|nr:hypothetical protein [uncultured Bacteroides sp.]
MSDYNSQYSGTRIEELLAMIPNLAKADLSNAMTVSLGSSGYAKFNNGLLIQWGGNISGIQGERTIYLPSSFMDTNYRVVLTADPGSKSIFDTIVSPMLLSRGTSYFKACLRYYDNGSIYGYGSWNIEWYAIGRWK